MSNESQDTDDSGAKSVLLRRMSRDSRFCYQWGKINNISDASIIIFAVICSIVAAILVSVPGVQKWVVAGFAAVPAACASVQQAINFRGRSSWYFEAAARYLGMKIRLETANNPNVEAYGREYSAVKVAMEDEWSNAIFGRGVGTRKSRQNPRASH